MSGWIVLAAYTAGTVALMVVSARAFLCNLRRLRHAGRVAPLDGLDLTGATVTAVPTPRTWPDLDAVVEPAVAAAYASLAEERAIGFVLVGDLATVVGGAALGTYLPRFVAGGIATWPAVAAVVVAAVGIMLRLRASRYWEPVSARYRARHASLTRAPLPQPPPRRLLDRFFGSR